MRLSCRKLTFEDKFARKYWSKRASRYYTKFAKRYNRRKMRRLMKGGINGD